MLLKVSGLKVGYGGIQAVKGVDFEVREGELVSLIGSNGAGKTTTMKAITGTLPCGAGDIEFLGRSIKGRGAWDLVGEGLVMVPEGRGVFTRMTITENLQIGAYIRKDKAAIASDMERDVRHLPAPARAQGPAGRHHVGRRTADARHGPRADGAPQGAAAGRTHHGPVADHVRQDLRGGADRGRAGRDDPAGGAERQPRAAAGRTAAT
jgi:energy-coupling factor transporter ATP-binding protein EcfA2